MNLSAGIGTLFVFFRISMIMKHLILIIFCAIFPVAFGQLSGTWQGVFIQAGTTMEEGTIIYLDISESNNTISGKIRNEGYESDLYSEKKFEGTITDGKIEFQERVVLDQKKTSRIKWCRYKGTMEYDSITGYMKGNYESTDCRRVVGQIILFRADFEFPSGENMTVSQVWFKRFIEDYKEGLNAPEIRKIERDNFVFEPIYFDYDKAEIRPEYYDFLNRLIKVVKGHSDLRVKVTGHTDSDGSDDYNIDLSKRRAQAIIDYFLAHGLSEDRLRFDFKGESSPVDTNKTDEGKQHNRRVDFEFI